MITPNPSSPGAATADPSAASLQMVAQYIKDLSFENPQAPNVALPPGQQPTLNIQVNVNARPMTETDFEVELAIEAMAEHASSAIFAIDLIYAGVLRIRNIPEQSIHPAVLIEGPRLLFPFARQIVSETVRDGGFPPLLLDPIDFAELYRQRVASQGQPPGSPQTN